MKILDEQQVRSYHHEGFLFPVPVLNAVEVAQCVRDLERAEAHIGQPLTRAELKWRGAAYAYLPWVDALVRHPRVLDVVEDVIGPDILVFWATFFIKEPATPAFAAWHQDATYFGLTPLEHVTAWVALSDADSEAGCMDVLPAHGRPRQWHHAAAGLANSINGAGQLIIEPLPEEEAVAMELRAGELSLHHTLCPHRSAPNRSTHRRIGLGISYIPAHARTTGAHRLTALPVRGSDRWNHFEHLPVPTAEFTPEGLAAHEHAYRRYRENYFEQARLHEAAFANGRPA